MEVIARSSHVIKCVVVAFLKKNATQLRSNGAAFEQFLRDAPAYDAAETCCMELDGMPGG